MTNLEVNVTNEIIDNLTENSPTINGVHFNESGPLTISVNKVYTGFTAVVKALLQTRISTSTIKNKCISYWRTKTVKGNYIEFVEIQNNSKTTELFNIFRKYGSFTTCIKFGYDEMNKTLYVSTKTARDMSRYPNETNAAIVLYYISLLSFIRATSTNITEITIDSYSEEIHVICKEDGLSKLFKGFENPFSVKITPSGEDDLVGIEYVINELSDYRSEVMGPAIKFAYLYDTEKAEYYGALIPLQLSSNAYTFVASESKIYTSFDLCTVEMRSDSICSLIASGYFKSISLVKYDDFKKLFENLEIVFCDTFELPEDLPGWLKAWSAQVISQNATAAVAADVKYLNTLYAIKPSKASIGCDPEEFKKQYAEDAYAQELYAQVKPYYDTFELGNLSANLAGFAKGAIYSMAFVGESGTGKSTAARVLPYKCGMPFLSVNFSVNIEEADLFGSMYPNPAKSSPKDPEFVWQDGVLTKAIRNGYVAILEELNFARPGVLGKLNSLLDENRQLDLPNGEILRAHPNFRIIATCNIAYEGTNRFNKALINRFDDVTVFKDLRREEAIDVIKSRTGYTDQAKLDKVYNVYEALKKFASEQNVNLVVSMRQLLNIFTKGKFYKDAKDAVTRIMLNGAFLEDIEYQKVFEDTILPSFDLKFKI